MNKTTKFALMIVNLADLLGLQESKGRIDKLAKFLSEELSEEEMQLACRQIALNDNRIPVPARFIEMARGSTKNRAEEQIEKVFKAFSLYGYNAADEAQGFLGPVAWRAIERMGGWYNVRTREGFNPQVFRAQLLNALQSLVECENREFQISQLESKKVQHLIAQTVKGINDETRSCAMHEMQGSRSSQDGALQPLSGSSVQVRPKVLG